MLQPKDLQTVNITCRVLSRPAIDKLPTIYREIGTDYDERVLPSVVNDLQMVNITWSAACRWQDATAHGIYREIGTDYDERVLPSVVNGQYRFSADEPPGPT
ncbi:unnamed protein product [Tilletia caries]|uniref:Prohibitin n=1 Tax=Tilletia caries TaxID=13290 RepID=A0ABN7J1P9_9BASI|nr:unnamed protein product [Tilletia caries]